MKLPDGAWHGLRVATDQEVDAVLGLDHLLIDDQLFAPVLGNFGLETLDGQLGASGGLFLSDRDLEALLLQRDGSIQRFDLFVERHQLVVVLGDLRDEAGDDIVPAVSCAEVAQRGRVSGTVQLSPDVDLPGDVGGDQEVWQRIGKVAAGGRRELVQLRSVGRVVAVFVQRRVGPERDERQPHPAPSHHLVVGNRDVLRQDLEFLVAGERLVDQAFEVGIIEKLCRHEASPSCPALVLPLNVGGSGGPRSPRRSLGIPQPDSNSRALETIAATIACFARDGLAKGFIRVVLDERIVCRTGDAQTRASCEARIGGSPADRRHRGKPVLRERSHSQRRLRTSVLLAQQSADEGFHRRRKPESAVNCE